MIRLFPVSGGASLTDDFSDPREGGRKHQGNDLFAPAGTAIIAVDNGTVRFGTDPLGGNVANLYATDGMRYYHAHLQSFEGASRKVQTGEVIGYLGDTGNAKGTPPHLHFEVHPPNQAPQDPYPLLRSAPRVTRTARSSALPVFLLASVVGAWYLSSTFRHWVREAIQ